jgi:DNA-binding transcriptional LysR family regulator
MRVPACSTAAPTSRFSGSPSRTPPPSPGGCWRASRGGSPCPQGTGSPVAGPFPFAELLEEPFLAPPASAGPLRDYWLATEERGERPIRIAAEVSTPDEAFEAVAGGVGVVLLSGGNAAIYKPAGVVCKPVGGLSPSQLAVAWRTRDERAVVRDFVAACRQAATEQR